MALLAGSASAQATRTWVSGVGDDANPCSRTAPCKTFAGAISKTTAGGEIDSLDPGGFGTLTITKSIVIDGGGGQVAGVSASGTVGFNIAAGPNDAVTIRNVRITGNNTGTNGINVVSAGAVHLENVTVTEFTTGINIAPSTATQVTLDRVVARDNVSNGLSATGPGSATLPKITVRDSSFLGTTAGPGITVGGNSIVTIRNVVSAGNSGAGFFVNGSGGAAQFTLFNSIASSNGGTGLLLAGTAGTPGVARISGGSFIFNTGGITIGTGCFVGSYGDNEITGGVSGGSLVTLAKQ